LHRLEARQGAAAEWAEDREHVGAVLGDDGRGFLRSDAEQGEIDATAGKVGANEAARRVIAEKGDGGGAPAEIGKIGQDVAARAAGLGARRLIRADYHVERDAAHAGNGGWEIDHAGHSTGLPSRNAPGYNPTVPSETEGDGKC